MAHGLLHLAGYKDKTLESQKIKTKKEEEYIKMYLNNIKLCKSNKYGRST
jgi:ssRNA-specific RNase YbeY (16S rRNA maturation enzyme)